MNKKQDGTERMTQKVSVRLPYSTYDKYEIACIEDDVKMSEVLREAVNRYLENRPNFTPLSQR